MTVSNEIIINVDGNHLVNWRGVVILFDNFALIPEQKIIELYKNENFILQSNCIEFYSMFEQLMGDEKFKNRKLN